jgi:hypothetical protein
MAIGTSLSTLIAQLRNEIGASSNTGQGVNQIPQLTQILQRTQRRLWLDYNWPHLLIDRDEPLLSGQRYYTFDPDIDYNRIVGAWVKYSNIFEPIGYGFNPTIYSAVNSEMGAKSDPVQLWRHYEGNQYEVWPVPATAAPTIVTKGSAVRVSDNLTVNNITFTFSSTSVSATTATANSLATGDQITISGFVPDNQVNLNGTWTITVASSTAFSFTIDTSPAFQTIRFRAIKQLTAISDDAGGGCILDDDLLVLFSAAEILARLKSADAQAKQTLAQSHYRNLRASTMKKDMFIMGNGLPRDDRGDWVIRVNPI